MPQIVEKGKSALGHKIGPLPVWGWVVAGAAGIFVVSKMRGGGSAGATGGSGIPIPTLTAGSGSTVGDGSIGTGGNAVGSPAQNVVGGSDTQAGGTAPWWATPPNWWGAAAGIVPGGQPSSNGSGGTTPSSTTAPKTVPVAAPDTSWWTRLLNPKGNLPSGAAVTNIGGTEYSLSGAALNRAAIPGATAVAPVPGARFENT